MVQFSIQVNTKQAERLFKTQPQKFKKAISRSVAKSAFLVKAKATRMAPVDTGRLRASIFTDIKELSATISPKVDYAIFVHEGTRFMRGRPFMVDALKDNIKKIEDIFFNEIVRSIK